MELFRTWLTGLLEAGETMRSISRRSGVSYDAVREIVRGRTKATSVTVAGAIARAYGKSLTDFNQGGALVDLSDPLLAAVVAELRQLAPEELRALQAGLEANAALKRKRSD